MADDSKREGEKAEGTEAAAQRKAELKRTAAESPEAKSGRQDPPDKSVDDDPLSRTRAESPIAKASEPPPPLDERGAADKVDKKDTPEKSGEAAKAIEKSEPNEPDTDEKKHLAVVSEAQLTKPPTGNVVAQAWLVLLLAAGFGAGLAGLEYSVGPTIAQNKLDETLEKVPKLVPGAAKGEVDEATIPGKRVFRAVDAEGNLVGWVVNGKGQGFADKIELIIGLDKNAETLTGVFVLEQKETPALGDNITKEDFRSHFIGIKTDRTLDAKAGATTNKETGVIQALTGATISSDAVCGIVNDTIGQMKTDLAAAAQKPVAMGEDQ